MIDGNGLVEIGIRLTFDEHAQLFANLIDLVLQFGGGCHTLATQLRVSITWDGIELNVGKFQMTLLSGWCFGKSPGPLLARFVTQTSQTILLLDRL